MTRPVLRIVCVGNRLVAADDLGPRVYQELVRRGRPDGVEVVDGGLAGLDLLRFLEGASRVVVVDAVTGDGVPSGPTVASAADVVHGVCPDCGHGGGVAAALAMLPVVVDPPQPEVHLVGFGGAATGADIGALADLSLRIARGEQGQ